MVKFIKICDTVLVLSFARLFLYWIFDSTGKYNQSNCNFDLIFQVYAVEGSSIAKHAEMLVRANKLDNVIQVRNKLNIEASERNEISLFY